MVRIARTPRFRRIRLFVILLVAISALPILATPATPLRAQSRDDPLPLLWSSIESHPTTSVAWGDADNDGDLDLAVGNFEKPNQLYLNDNSALHEVWLSEPQSEAGTYERTTSVAWGDYDNDGDLDLLVGNGAPFYADVTSPDDIQGQRSRIYRNCTTRRAGDGCLLGEPYLTQRSVWQTDELSATLSVAWGDYDNDGDLDFAAGNGAFKRVDEPTGPSSAIPLPVGQADQLYRNNWPQPGFTPFALIPTPIADPTTSVAWGDYDQDGKLDLLVGNIGLDQVGLCDVSPQDCGDVSRVYRNITPATPGAPPAFEVAWEASARAITFSATWADANNDEALDLAFGNVSVRNTLLNVVGHNRLYLNTGCASQCAPPAAAFSLADWTPESNDLTGETTISLAWGDYDNDGDLDLAAGNAGAAGSAVVGQPVRIYRNCTTTQPQDGCTPGDVLSTQAVWQSQERDDTFSVAWGDLDNDGDLNLLAGNMGVLFSVELPGQPNRLYRNDLGVFSTRAITQAPGTNPAALSVAWGDYTGDGYPDLAVGTRELTGTVVLTGTVKLFKNTLGTLAPDQILVVDQPVAAIAWGDVDGDGQLDLAAGDTSGNFRLFLNSAGILAPAAAWRLPADPIVALGAAWGDVDNDGDLDLAVGAAGSEDGQGNGQPNYLYYNCRIRQSGDGCAGPGLLSPQPWVSAEHDHTTGVAWGDVDNDGDLDLAAGNMRGPNRLYRNQHGVLQLDTSWAPARDATVSLAWGDYDADGYLDLAVGNIGRPKQVYRNNRGVLPSIPTWSSIEADITVSVAWGDMDNDGDLDLAVGNAGFFDGGVDTPQRNRIYRNDNNRLDARASWTSDEADFTAGVAWADADNDGDLDLVAANTSTPLRLYRNDRALGGRGAVPIVHIGQPQARPPLPPANFYATPQILSGPTLTFSYTLAHPRSLPVQQLIGEYSLNGGGSWAPALPAPGTQTANLATSPAGRSYTYTWDIFGSGIMGQSDNVVFRLRVIPDYRAQPNQPNQAPDRYLYGSFTATTYPFRLRGTQVQVFNGAAPAADAIVYRRARGASQADLFPEPPANQGPLRTDARGFLQGRGLLGIGDEIAALVPISSTDTYTLYFTSAAPNAGGLQLQPVRALGIQRLTVSPQQPLLLLNLKIALEWDARNDTVYTAQLRRDLQRTSELLFDLANGQAALGDITIYHGRTHWDDAHIRIYATNRFRPNAVKGGMVTRVITDPLSLRQTSALSPALTYEPGQARIGAIWNRFGTLSSPSGDDWPRTLAHELGHYAFFLDDNYIGLNDSGLLIPVDDCRGVMADPYSDEDSEFHPPVGWLPTCADTLSNQATRIKANGQMLREGRSDWETIATFYPWLRQPSTSFAQINAGPATLPLAITHIHDVLPSLAAGTAPPQADFFVSLKQDDGSPDLASSSARAILFQHNRLIDLGRPAADQVLVRGARLGDRLCVYDLAVQRQGCRPIAAGGQALGMAPRANWAPDITVTPVTSRTVHIQVQQVSAGLTLTAQLYPVNSSASPSAARQLVYRNGLYSGTFTLDQPSFEGYMHLWAFPGGARTEAIADYLLGGNPGRKWAGFAPRGSPGRKWAGFAPVISADGQVVIYDQAIEFPEGTFAAIQSATRLPPPPPWAVPIGTAYRLTRSPGAPTLTGASIDIGYFERDLRPGTEGGLAIFYAGPDGLWQKLRTEPAPDRNEVSAQLRGEGVYALMTDLQIQPGWNIVAYPWSHTNSVTKTLGLVQGQDRYTTVYGYLPSNQADPWQVYDIDVPRWVNDLAALEYGRGYWINATLGSLNPTSRVPQALATPSLPQPPATFYTTLAGAGLGAGLPVVARIGGVVCGEVATRNEQGAIVFAVDVFAADDGLRAGCGVPGRVVTFTVGGRVLPTTARWDNRRPTQLALDDRTDPRKLYLPLVRR